MDFNQIIETTKEIGYVTKVFASIVHVDGLPNVRLREIVIFESNHLGQVMTLAENHIEVLLLDATRISVGTRVTRSNKEATLEVSDNLLGSVISPLGNIYQKGNVNEGKSEVRNLDVDPENMSERVAIKDPLLTGVSIVDLVIPVAKGQRELVIGDRKIGKSPFLLQLISSQENTDTVCIYAAIAKKRLDLQMIHNHINSSPVKDRTVLIATSSDDPIGLIFLTPFAALTIAEYFRDQGKNVLVILDDLTAHAKYYREISLVARRFPGRSSYPGDIFYVHAKLMERGGAFKKGSITIVPVSETILGDLSGYIQTNLMSMTDGHIFFDSNLYNIGRRPAINPFLSVTRVGRQVQTDLLRDVNRQVTSFLVKHEQMGQFMHFGAELTEATKRTIHLGERVIEFFIQDSDVFIHPHLSAVILAGLWGGKWLDLNSQDFRQLITALNDRFSKDGNFQSVITQLISSAKTMEDLSRAVIENEQSFN